MGEVSAMASLLTTLTSVATCIVTVAGNIVTFVMAEGHELALLPVGVLLLYSGIATFKKIVC